MMLHSAIVASNSRNIDRRHDSLTARSIVLSLLLGSHPPRLPVSALVQFCSLFGIAGGTVRTALSRMVERGELRVDDANYRLSGRLLDRQAEQDVGRVRRTTEWEHDWWIVMVTADRRSVTDRRAFRSRAIGAKLGELRPDLWMRPANLDIPGDLFGVLVARGPLVDADDSALARSLWDLDSIDDHNRTLASALHEAGVDLTADGPAALPTAFVTLTEGLRHLRVEPQLPADLHPPASSDALRAIYRDVELAFRRELREWLRERRQ